MCCFPDEVANHAILTICIHFMILLDTACTDAQFDCRVMTGMFTSYFPKGTDPVVIEKEMKQMLDIVNDELASDNWNGMKVSYNNAPFASENLVEENDNGSGGLSTGGIIGVVIGMLVLLALVAVSAILLIRRRKEKDEAVAPRVIPFGVEESLHSKNDDDDSDSEDSSSSSSSSDDDGDTAELGTPSVVSDDNTFNTFPTTMAQAKPQDIEDDDSSESSSESEDESRASNDDSEIDNPSNNLSDLQKSDEDHVYVPDADFRDSYERDEGDHEYVERNTMEEYPQNYDDNDHDEYNPHGKATPYRKISSNGSASSGGSGHSMNSADPPGKSYRDLHVSDDYHDEWDGMQAPPQHQMRGDVAAYNDQAVEAAGDYLPDSPHNSFAAYESNSVTSADHISRGSYHSNGSRHSNNESYHSFSIEDDGVDGDGGYDEVPTDYDNLQNSLHSNESYTHSFSIEDGQVDGDEVYDESDPNSLNSHHASYNHSLFGAEDDQVDSGVGYDESDPNSLQSHHADKSDPNYDDRRGSYHSFDQERDNVGRNERNDKDRSNHDSGPYDDHYIDDPYHERYDENYDYDQYAHEVNSGNNYNDGRFRKVNDGVVYDQSASRETGSRSYDDGDEANNDSFNDGDSYDERLHNRPVVTPVHSAHSSFHKEELDDYVDDATQATHSTQVTQKMSNLSSPAPTYSSNNSGPVSSPKEMEKIKPNNGNNRQEMYGEEEESITHIFKSLSEIQTRLATKGKSSSRDAAKDGQKGKSKRDHQNTPKAKPHATNQPSDRPGWERDGIVEDASVDGSLASTTFAANAARNRHPQNGQWMEPVDEDVD